MLSSKIYDDKVDAYCIERQSWRKIGPSMTIPHSILRAVAVETIMFSLLKEKTSLPTLIESISPRAVAECFDLRSETTTKYTDKKKRAICLVDNWINNGTIDISSGLIERYQQSPKKDDLSDALIMATAYAKWNHNLLKFIKEHPLNI